MRAICPQSMRVSDTQLENLPFLDTLLPQSQISRSWRA